MCYNIGMIRIWAKAVRDGKILKQVVYENFSSLDYAKFHEYVREICEELDCPTPVIIKAHLFSYAKYNNVKFKKDDFVEEVDFDRLILENALI